jgi:hypothetical protein
MLSYPSAMSKYATLLFAPEEYHEIGPFRFPIYHDLVPGEAKGIEAISRQQSRSTFSSIKLAQRIAKDKGISTKEAIDILGNTTEENQDILYDYAPELEELQRNTVGAVETQISFVTLFMKYRAEIKLPKAKDWQRVEDWSAEDTEAMPTKLLEDVFRLISWERDGWPEPETEGKSAAEDEEQEFSPPPSNS